jgi:dipeptide/tripeptide permease
VLFFAWKNQQRKQPGEHFWDVARARFSEREVDAARSVLPILSVFALAPVFWALFDQTFSTWVLQGEQMKPYYVGSATLSASQIREPDSLVVKLQSGTNAAAGFLWGQFSANGKQLLSNPSTQRSARQSCLADELNAVIGSGSIFSPDRFETNKLTGEIRVMLAAAPVPETTAYLNRILIERTFPEEIGACYRIGPEEMLSANPILVMLLVPVMTLLIYPALGRFATPLRRMSYGMFLSAFSFVLVAWMQRELDAGVEMSVLWQTVPDVIITIAEVFFSTTGLEFAFREAAPEMKSTIMGFWQLTVAFGNLLVSVVTAVAGRLVGSSEGHVSVTPMMFLFYAGLTFVVAILFSLVTMRYRYQDKAAAEGR